MECSKCGELISDEANFCPKCGEKINSEYTPDPEIAMLLKHLRNPFVLIWLWFLSGLFVTPRILKYAKNIVEIYSWCAEYYGVSDGITLKIGKEDSYDDSNRLTYNIVCTAIDESVTDESMDKIAKATFTIKVNEKDDDFICDLISRDEIFITFSKKSIKNITFNSPEGDGEKSKADMVESIKNTCKLFPAGCKNCLQLESVDDKEYYWCKNIRHAFKLNTDVIG